MMKNIVLLERLNKVITELEIRDNDIVVLKGIPISLLDTSFQLKNLSDIAANKLAYLNEIYRSGRRYITFGEMLILGNLIIEQYKNIYIVNNNIFINLYPIYELISDEDRKCLLTHFAESDNEYDDSYIGDLEELIGIFNGLKEIDGFSVGSYYERHIENNIKIKNIDLFDYVECPIEQVKKDRKDEEFIELIDEDNYLQLIKLIYNNCKIVYISYDNYADDVEQIVYHIDILNRYFGKNTKIFNFRFDESVTRPPYNKEFKEILLKYWRHSDFRLLQIYDIEKLPQKKETQPISQEKIISEIVEQVEHCITKEYYRDIFITAPTGAGKSVMFQIPAIYLAEKYKLLTIVISPLIGLMNDQVNNLEQRGYRRAKTINSNISPIVKQEILENVAQGNYDILYLSPETLLARSDIEQIIGDRTIGMIIIDEAHIVTTWGKQFRPDYWYLGDHIRKLRKNQVEKKDISFIIAAFTATAIYKGIEDMYIETRNSLHMIDPLTYLGYIKRDDIDIFIKKSVDNKSIRTEYLTDKFEQIASIVKRAKITEEKTLVYFPTVSLIEQCYQYLQMKGIHGDVTFYYGPLQKDKKIENYHMFYEGNKQVMLATKAFGMGIDINNIQLVVHFAPTGNVCDYVQEIGRAAREPNLKGEAYYHYNSRDFRYINRLHGLSTIKKYQLIEIIKKIYELYILNRKQNISMRTKRKNAFLLDAENFTYLFKKFSKDDDESINKVKTALLIIQKDFESRFGFSPINVRPIPLFSIGYFCISLQIQKKIKSIFGDCLQEINSTLNVCKVNLDVIWNKMYTNKSFPQFKYLLYSKSTELDFNERYDIKPVLAVRINLSDNYHYIFRRYMITFRKLAKEYIVTQKFISEEEIELFVAKECDITSYKAQTICEVFFAAIEIFRRNFADSFSSVLRRKELQNGSIQYQFKVAINSFFSWLENKFSEIIKDISDGLIYIINPYSSKAKEISTVLGILEAMDVLNFEMKGGANSQLYVYINQIRHLELIINSPSTYHNRLLDIVHKRHKISVAMLTYIYEGNFTSEQIWNMLEDYFLGIIPPPVISKFDQSESSSISN